MSDFLKKPMLEKHKEDFERIRQRITEALKDYENFDGVNFVDVNARGIQVNGLHKKTGRYYFHTVTIKYDFSNVDEAIEDFVNGWKHYDNPSYISDFLQFLEWGEKYGWD